MEKWASKWLEMRSQIHRFYKKFPGEAPVPPNERGVQPPSHTLPLPPRGFRRSVQDFGFQCPPATASLGPALFCLINVIIQAIWVAFSSSSECLGNAALFYCGNP